MHRILVTGMSGAGKSSALAGLARRGFRTVDTDEPGWTIEDEEGGRWWDEEKIARLLVEEGPTLYVGKSPAHRKLIVGHLREVEAAAPGDGARTRSTRACRSTSAS